MRAKKNPNMQTKINMSEHPNTALRNNEITEKWYIFNRIGFN